MKEWIPPFLKQLELLTWNDSTIILKEGLQAHPK